MNFESALIVSHSSISDISTRVVAALPKKPSPSPIRLLCCILPHSVHLNRSTLRPKGTILSSPIGLSRSKLCLFESETEDKSSYLLDAVGCLPGHKESRLGPKTQKWKDWTTGGGRQAACRLVPCRWRSGPLGRFLSFPPPPHGAHHVFLRCSK